MGAITAARTEQAVKAERDERIIWLLSSIRKNNSSTSLWPYRKDGIADFPRLARPEAADSPHNARQFRACQAREVSKNAQADRRDSAHTAATAAATDSAGCESERIPEGEEAFARKKAKKERHTDTLQRNETTHVCQVRILQLHIRPGAEPRSPCHNSCQSKRVADRPGGGLQTFRTPSSPSFLAVPAGARRPLLAIAQTDRRRHGSASGPVAAYRHAALGCRWQTSIDVQQHRLAAGHKNSIPSDIR